MISWWGQPDGVGWLSVDLVSIRRGATSGVGYKDEIIMPFILMAIQQGPNFICVDDNTHQHCAHIVNAAF